MTGVLRPKSGEAKAPNPELQPLERPIVGAHLSVRRRWMSGPFRIRTRPLQARAPSEPQIVALLIKEDAMRTTDLSPLYRSVVGFDRLASLLDAASVDSAQGYPPYNIERTGENDYLIEIAVAGFKPAELTIEVKENLLTVEGQKAANEETRRFLHRGLAERNFKRRFQLADYVLVRDAQLVDGLLSVSLRRELPEQLKPRTIEIKTDVA